MGWLVWVVMASCGAEVPADRVAPAVDASVVRSAPPAAPAALSPFLLRALVSLPEEIRLEPPSVATPERLARGAALYHQKCTFCHGLHGEGNGPVTSVVTPPPANLAAHNLDGLPTDGERREILRQGIPGTAMPGFGGYLDAEAIGSLVVWIRTLRPQSPR